MDYANTFIPSQQSPVRSSWTDLCPCGRGRLVAPSDNHNRARELDQFYTRYDVAADLLASLRLQIDLSRYLVIEPSAGTGSFFLQLPPFSLGYDIEPKCSGVISADFLSVTLPNDRPIAVIGNPPFGRNCATAVKFFNHAATTAEVIAFIVPKTFKKISIQNRLSLDFHLIAEIPMPAHAFIFEGKPKDVPTVFQIWRRLGPSRDKVNLPITHADFAFVRDPRQANVVMQRVGARAGRMHFDFSRSANSHYFIRVRSSEVLERMRKVDFVTIASCSAGCPSLSKAELVYAFSNRRDLQTAV